LINNKIVNIGHIRKKVRYFLINIRSIRSLYATHTIYCAKTLQLSTVKGQNAIGTTLPNTLSGRNNIIKHKERLLNFLTHKIGTIIYCIFEGNYSPGSRKY